MKEGAGTLLVTLHILEDAAWLANACLSSIPEDHIHFPSRCYRTLQPGTEEMVAFLLQGPEQLPYIPPF